MNIRRIFSLLLLSAILTAPAWADAQKGQPIKTTGTIKHQGLEGGFWGIVGDDGQNYDPQNLAPEFQKEGLRVSFEAETKPDVASFHMWGTIVEIKSIGKLENLSGAPEGTQMVRGTVDRNNKKVLEATKAVLAMRGDTTIGEAEAIFTKPHAIDKATLLASYTSTTKPEESGYTHGTYELIITLMGWSKKNRTTVKVRAKIMAFGRAHVAMAKPDSWDPVPSNGKIESEVLKAIQEEAKKRK